MVTDGYASTAGAQFTAWLASEALLKARIFLVGGTMTTIRSLSAEETVVLLLLTLTGLNFVKVCRLVTSHTYLDLHCYYVDWIQIYGLIISW